jgi:hypothetical protein
MAQAIQIGPRKYLDPDTLFVRTLNPSPTIPLLIEQASTEDAAAAAHLMWWRSPEALAFRTGIKIEHATGIVSRWSLAASTQGRWWIAVELWADVSTAISNKQTIPRHIDPRLITAQLDGRVVESMRRAA